MLPFLARLLFVRHPLTGCLLAALVTPACFALGWTVGGRLWAGAVDGDDRPRSR